MAKRCSLRIPYLTRLLEIKEYQLKIEAVKVSLLSEIRNTLLDVRGEMLKNGKRN